VAKLLHVSVPGSLKRKVEFDFEAGDQIRSDMQRIVLADGSAAAGKRIVELNIPDKVNILALKRKDVFIAPNGSTKLLQGDVLYVLSEDKPSLELLDHALK